MKTTWSTVLLRAAAAALLCAGPALVAAPAAQAGPPAAPAPGLPGTVDSLVPAPMLPPVTAPVPPIVGAGTPAAVEALRAAIMPANVGDPFFDAWPQGLDARPDGAVLATRDVTAPTAPLVGGGIAQALQFKVKTTDSSGAPSFATATMLLPRTPWTGPGTRPVLVNNLPIDALGRACTPGYTMAHGLSFTTTVTDFVPPTTQLAIQHGYAVLIPDHEGPRMAYAEPYVAGHAILDSIRGLRNLRPAEFGDSRIAMTGYSGGAIATYGATKLIGSYAPELAGHIVGSALGGVPADFEMLTHSMNGNLASGLFQAATLGIARERPEILELANNLAQQMATSPLKDQCVYELGATGVTLLPINVMANVLDPLHSPVAEHIYTEMRMPGMRSTAPLYIYNGAQEFWIPAQGARELYDEQCRMGVSAVYRAVPGEHAIAALTGYPGAMTWLDQRLQGQPAPNECGRG
ncbi:lipase family protein [Speluncibacter jeojiensis]|uniref:Lipase family protein n=1 Tax=Speluncibacter jeojiensis TaxID=2710754 RepID=A0A9X4M316_9ACTN|nr:lipase family protein [Corynebacteriales bacterium D3-21]